MLSTLQQTKYFSHEKKKTLYLVDVVQKFRVVFMQMVENWI